MRDAPGRPIRTLIQFRGAARASQAAGRVDRISNASRKITGLYGQGYAPMVDSISNNSALPYCTEPDFKQPQFAVKLTHQLSAGQLTGSYILTRRPRLLLESITAIANPNFGNVISLTGEPRQGQIGLLFE